MFGCGDRALKLSVLLVVLLAAAAEAANAGGVL